MYSSCIATSRLQQRIYTDHGCQWIWAGATLSQIFDNEEEHPISYASRTLKEEEMRYPPIDREALGVLWAVNHYEEYLEGNHFTVYTDHKPLVTLMTKAEPAKRLAHYAMQLEHFTFTIKYKPGVTNIDADALSRLERYPVKPLKTKKTKVVQTNESSSNDFDATSKLANNSRLTRQNTTRQRWIAESSGLFTYPTSQGAGPRRRRRSSHANCRGR